MSITAVVMSTTESPHRLHLSWCYVQRRSNLHDICSNTLDHLVLLYWIVFNCHLSNIRPTRKLYVAYTFSHSTAGPFDSVLRFQPVQLHASAIVNVN